MKAPISWLKEYVEIKLDLKNLMWRLTEIGLTCESYEVIDGEKILDIEVTPNRPDWLSITGIAREIAIIENSKLNLPVITKIEKPKAKLPIEINNDYLLCPSYAAITIEGVTQKESPKWLQNRLVNVGLRPIINLVDITNYVMFELGNPIHVFDYNKLYKGSLEISLSDGGEEFDSVDDKKYTLPKNAIIFKSGGKVVDLCGIKGGLNSGITDSTKNILILVAVYNGTLIRKTSQQLQLHSEASYIFERGANLGGTTQTLSRAVNLVQELAGGEIACPQTVDADKNIKSIDIKLNIQEVNEMLGIDIAQGKIRNILEKLDLSPTIKNEQIICKIPLIRGDLKIKEDLYEEIARIYSYNKFPRTLPSGKTASVKIPYFYDRDFELFLKNITSSAGFFEISSGALTSKEIIEKSRLNPENHIKIANPVSNEYEYMRTSLMPTLLAGIKANTEENLKLFEFGKVYLAPVDKAQEFYKISGVLRNSKFENTKGLLDLLLDKLNITNVEIKSFAISHGLWHPNRAGVIEKDGEELGIFGEVNPKILYNFGLKENIFGFELDVAKLKKFQNSYLFKPIPKFPPQIEDITLVIKGKIEVGKVIREIKKTKFVEDVTMLGTYQNTITLRINYSDLNKTLTDKEVGEIRKGILKSLSGKFSIKQK